MNLSAHGRGVRLQADSLHAWIILSKDCLMSFSLIRRLLVILLAGLCCALHPDTQQYFRGWHFLLLFIGKGERKGKGAGECSPMHFSFARSLSLCFTAFGSMTLSKGLSPVRGWMYRGEGLNHTRTYSW